MSQGYHDFISHPFNYQLDEFFVEYVDGTMDPVVRETFEEYLDQNPDLMEQVCHMRQVRNAMCGLGCGCMAPDGFQKRLRNKLGFEILSENLPGFTRLPNLNIILLLVLVASLGSLSLIVPSQESGLPSSTAAAVSPGPSFESLVSRVYDGKSAQVKYPASLLPSADLAGFRTTTPGSTTKRLSQVKPAFTRQTSGDPAVLTCPDRSRD